MLEEIMRMIRSDQYNDQEIAELVNCFAWCMDSDDRGRVMNLISERRLGLFERLGKLPDSIGEYSPETMLQNPDLFSDMWIELVVAANLKYLRDEERQIQAKRNRILGLISQHRPSLARLFKS